MAQAGILVFRSEQGLQFVDAAAITVNGKDKAAGLGPQSAISTAVSKLSSARFTGTLLRDADVGAVLEYDPGRLNYLVPEGLPKNSPADLAGMWKVSKISYKAAENSKTATDVAGEFVAFLPAGADDLATLCMDTQALQLIGGKGKGFQMQVALMSAAVKAYTGNPDIAPLETYVEQAMRSRYEAFEGGTAGVDVLEEGLRFAQLSQAAYPNSSEQVKLRKQLADRRAWLDRRIAVQKAFAAASQWDALLLGDRELERYQQYFPDIVKAHTAALQGSLQSHIKAAKEYLAEANYGPAWREYHLASLRKPSDSALQDEVEQSWTEYSRRHALDVQPKRIKISAGAQSTVDRDLYFAEQNRTANKLDDALKNVQDAEAVLQSALPGGGVSASSLKAWYAKAEILGAQNRVADALATLDKYDLEAVEDEREKAQKLRNQLLFNLTSLLKTVKSKLQSALDEGNFVSLQNMTAQGLSMAADDADLLYYAGLVALVRRQPKQGREYFLHYLDASNTLDSNLEQRAQVIRMLSSIAAPLSEGEGEPNWFSGEKLPKGVFYSPYSLAFQAHIDHIEASNKFRVNFDWGPEKLKSILPIFEKADHITGEQALFFHYDKDLPQVDWIGGDNETPPPAPPDPDEAYRKAFVLLPNNPLIDPLAVQRLTGKSLGLVMTGNRFFNPFVWEKIYYFSLTYDDRGRVVHAQQVNGPKRAPGEQALDFEWNGLQLTAIRGSVNKVQNYERVMRYRDGLLVSEDIHGGGKSSRIKYSYAGNRLVSADGATDGTLDNRSRKVVFMAASPSTVMK
jgi:hypothetical protein